MQTGRHRGDVSSGVYFSFLAAYDPLWKTADMGWLEAERHTGLFTADRKPKPAVLEVDWINKPQ